MIILCYLFGEIWSVVKNLVKSKNRFGKNWPFDHKIWPNRQIWSNQRQIYFGDLTKFGDLAKFLVICRKSNYGHKNGQEN